MNRNNGMTNVNDKSIRKYIKVFGIEGISIYLNIRFNRTENIFIPNISKPISLRSKTSDIPTFYQVFLDEEYNIKLDFNPETIIDAGANIGLAAIYFANRYPQAKIISIEPENANYQLLKKNIRHYKNVSTLKKALSNTSDQNLYVNDNGFGDWGFMTESENKSENNRFKNSVKTISIDDIMTENNYGSLDIVKIDIEGGEKELFMSNTEKWLPNTRCLIIELHDRMKLGCSTSFFKAISQYDFSCSLEGENLVFINNSRNIG